MAQKLEWFATLRARLGVTPTPDSLLYATGGLALGGIRTSGTITGSSLTLTPGVIEGVTESLVAAVDESGNPIVDENGNPIQVPVTVPVETPTVTASTSPATTSFDSRTTKAGFAVGPAPRFVSPATGRARSNTSISISAASRPPQPIR